MLTIPPPPVMHPSILSFSSQIPRFTLHCRIEKDGTLAKPAIRELPLVQALSLDVELIDQHLAVMDKESKKVAAHENVR